MTKEILSMERAFNLALEGRTFMPTDEFVRFALYHPKHGYYISDTKRVGKGRDTDFYTSNSHGELWGELVVEACSEILGAEQIKKHSFVEIAAEPNCSILKGIDTPFETTNTIRLGDKAQIPSKSVVFSNEWLDAQPFKRFRFNKKKRRWLEIGVTLKNNIFEEVELPLSDTPINFPKNCIDGYTIDWPIGAYNALNSVISQKWKGLFLTFDYGLSREIIFKERPTGTARSYYKHQICKSLFTRVGKQDLTCHVCWDELRECMLKNFFSEIKLETQESFLMNHSQKKIKKIFKSTDNPINQQMLKLRELIHPQHFGGKFQALWGIRG
jgi:SAM-dependent MidA family methyltransferase